MIYEVNQANNLQLDITIEDNDGTLNIQGFDIYFKVKDGNERKFLKTLEDGITIVDAENGKVEVFLTKEDTDIDVGRYTYELLVIDSEGNRYTAKQGGFRVLRSITKEVG